MWQGALFYAINNNFLWHHADWFIGKKINVLHSTLCPCVPLYSHEAKCGLTERTKLKYTEKEGIKSLDNIFYEHNYTYSKKWQGQINIHSQEVKIQTTDKEIHKK